MYSIINGSCEDILPTVTTQIDMVLVDLPYGTTQAAWDTPIDLSLMWYNLNNLLKPNTPVVMFAQTPFDKILGASNIQKLKYEWIWEKTAATGHLNSKKMPMKAHENILVFYDKLPTYNPQKTQGHSPTHSYTKKNNSDGELYGQTKSVSGGGNTDRFPRDVLLFASDKQKIKLHSTQKPVALLEYLIKTYTHENQTVLDFTMGSGSTGVACLNTNRNFIGIEKDQKIFQIAKDRLESHIIQN